MKTWIDLAKYFYPKPTVIFADTLPSDEPVVFVANHEKNYGPSVMQLFFPVKYRPWVIYNMLSVEACQPYVQESFFEERLGWPKKISGFFSQILASTLVKLMKATNPVPVYREKPSRIVETFRESMHALQQNEKLLIFPENPNAADYSEDLKEFFDGFLYLAKLYERKTGKGLLFCPVSINPQNQSLTIGKKIRYQVHAEYAAESERIRQHLMKEIAKRYWQPWSSAAQPEAAGEFFPKTI